MAENPRRKGILSYLLNNRLWEMFWLLIVGVLLLLSDTRIWDRAKNGERFEVRKSASMGWATDPAMLNHQPLRHDKSP